MRTRIRWPKRPQRDNAEVTKPLAAAHVDDRHVQHRLELAKEAATMALYVSICLLAALTVVSDSELVHGRTVFKVIWGTTLGLALAHLFAFRLSARLVAAGSIQRADAEVAAAQFAGSLVVAVLATVPVLLLDGEAEPSVTRWVLAGFIALVGFVVARSSGASKVRSAVYASATTVIALAIVVIKNVLSGH
jgi:hypothetical protein